MIKETERTQIIKERHRYCDICGGGAKTHCYMCNKDLCNKCVTHEKYDYGDYRGDCYCKECWQLGENIRSQIEEYEYKIESLESEWSQMCKK